MFILFYFFWSKFLNSKITFTNWTKEKLNKGYMFFILQMHECICVCFIKNNREQLMKGYEWDHPLVSPSCHKGRGMKWTKQVVFTQYPLLIRQIYRNMIVLRFAWLRTWQWVKLIALIENHSCLWSRDYLNEL